MCKKPLFLAKIVEIHAKTNISAAAIYYTNLPEEPNNGQHYCPECGGECQYMFGTKHYVCKSCGLSVTGQELMDLRDKNRPAHETEEEVRQSTAVKNT